MAKITKTIYDNPKNIEYPENWFNPPSYEKIFKAGKFFNEKNNKKYLLIQNIYTILIHRALESGSDTKITNKKLAENFKVSERTIIRAIDFLEKNNLIVVLRKRTSGGVNNNGFKTIRIIRVWLSYYLGGLKAADSALFKTDIRPGKEVEEKIKAKVPLKYKVYREHTTYSKIENKEVFLTPYKKLNLDGALELGLINQTMYNFLMLWEGMISMGGRDQWYNIFGYSVKSIIKKNKGALNVSSEQTEIGIETHDHSVGTTERQSSDNFKSHG